MFMDFMLCRFYFRNWHGLGEKEPTVTRHAPRTGNGAEQITSPLLEMTSLEYLFAQVIFKYLSFSSEHPNGYSFQLYLTPVVHVILADTIVHKNAFIMFEIFT